MTLQSTTELYLYTTTGSGGHSLGDVGVVVLSVHRARARVGVRVGVRARVRARNRAVQICDDLIG